MYMNIVRKIKQIYRRFIWGSTGAHTNAGLEYCFKYAISPLIVIFFPSKITFLIKRKTDLVFQDSKIPMGSSPLDDFIVVWFQDKSFVEANVIMRGAYDSKLNDQIPNVFVNPTFDPNELFLENKNNYFATSDRGIFRKAYGVEDVRKINHPEWRGQKILFLGIESPDAMEEFKDIKQSGSSLNLAKFIEKRTGLDQYIVHPDLENLSICAIAHRSYQAEIKLGSGLTAIVGMLSITKNLSVYGWDHYLNKRLPENVFTGVFRMWAGGRDSSYFAASIFNFVYAYRLKSSKTLNKLTVYGHMSLQNHKWITRYLYPFLYKP